MFYRPITVKELIQLINKYNIVFNEITTTFNKLNEVMTVHIEAEHEFEGLIRTEMFNLVNMINNLKEDQTKKDKNTNENIKGYG